MTKTVINIDNMSKEELAKRLNELTDYTRELEKLSTYAKWLSNDITQLNSLCEFEELYQDDDPSYVEGLNDSQERFEIQYRKVRQIIVEQKAGDNKSR